MKSIIMLIVGHRGTAITPKPWCGRVPTAGWQKLLAVFLALSG